MSAKVGLTATARSTKRRADSYSRQALDIRQTPEVGEGERGNGPGDLAGDAQSLPAGGQDAQLRTGTQQRLGELGAGLDQMLAVVQNQQHLLGSEVVRERLGQRAARLLANAQGGGHRLWHERRIRQRRQLHQPHTVFEPFHQLARRRQSQPRLAAAARAGERQQAAILQQPLYLGQLLLPSDEAGELQRQVVGRTLRDARGGFRLGRFYGAKPPRVLGRSEVISFSLAPGGVITFSYP